MTRFRTPAVAILLTLSLHGIAIAGPQPSSSQPGQVTTVQATSRGRPFTYEESCYRITLESGNQSRTLIGAGDLDRQRNTFSGMLGYFNLSWGYGGFLNLRSGQAVLSALMGVGAVSGLRNPAICNEDPGCVISNSANTYTPEGDRVSLVKNIPVKLAYRCVD